MTRFVFDDRETVLAAAFRARAEGRADVDVVQRRLDLGDVLLDDVAEGGTVVLVERKQVRDLMASFFDGRLAEQCGRMRQWQDDQPPGTAWLAIIVEGIATPATFGRAGGAPDDVRYRHFVKTQLQLVLASCPAEGRQQLEGMS
jgi:hypothetical protein